MNLIGLDYNGVGNHEFDEGAAELDPNAERRVPPRRGLLRRRRVRRRRLPVPRRQRDLQGHRRDDLPAVCDPRVPRRQGRRRRHDARGHAEHRDGGGDGRHRLPRRSRLGERVGPGAQAAGRGDDRRPAPPGWVGQRGRSTRPPSTSATTRGRSGSARSPMSSRASIERSTLVVTGHTNWGLNCPNFAGTGIMVTGAASVGRVVDRRRPDDQPVRPKRSRSRLRSTTSSSAETSKPAAPRPHGPDHPVRRDRRSDRESGARNGPAALDAHAERGGRVVARRHHRRRPAVGDLRAVLASRQRRPAVDRVHELRRHPRRHQRR